MNHLGAGATIARPQGLNSRTPGPQARHPAKRPTLKLGKEGIPPTV